MLFNKNQKEAFAKAFLLLIIGVIGITSCKTKGKCDGVDSQTEVPILTTAKSSLLGFSTGTSWIFQCVSTPAYKDTLILVSSPTLPYDVGSCVDNLNCCSKYYYEHVQQNLQIHSNSGLNNFNSYFLEAGGFWMGGTWGTINIQNGDPLYKSFPGYSFKDTLTLSISGKTLYDIQVGGQYRSDTTPDYCYWSKQYGLVKYSYKTVSGTIIKEYERVDIL